MYVVDKLANGKFSVSGFHTEFTAVELAALRKLISNEEGLTLWVI